MKHRSVIDQLGRRVEIPFPPQRIISLVPSQTELLFDLGLANRMVGRTKFCVHPESEVKKVQVVGGTKNLRLATIKKLKPDLIVGNKEENDKESIAALQAFFPVWMTDVVTIKDAIATVISFGELTGAVDKSATLASQISDALGTVKGNFSGKVVYLIWRKPWMAAGGQTFINVMLDWLGFENVVRQNRYPEYNHSEMRDLQPQHVFLSSEPFPFNEEHVNELQLVFPASQFHSVNGEMFSWYGSRLIKAAAYFKNFKVCYTV